MKLADKRWFALALLLFLVFPFGAFAYTTPGTGVVWTESDVANDAGDVIVWSDADNAYISTEPITIAATDSIIFRYSFIIQTTGVDQDIDIFGSLTVYPAVDDSVYFTGEAMTDGDGPGGFRVEEGGHLHFDRVVLVGGGSDGVDDGVRISSGGAAWIDHSRIGNWKNYAARISGGNLWVHDTYFHDNRDNTVTANLSSTLTMIGCTLVRNNLNTPASGKTAISIGTQGDNVATIDSCFISGTPDNRQGGINIWNALGTTQQATITHTTIQNCAFGINVQGQGAQASITDCYLLDNNAYSDPMISGSGISAYSGATVRASHNIIIGNWWGITLPSTSGTTVVNLGETDATEYDLEGQNVIFGNVNEGSTWGLFNNGPNAVTAQNNYWGALDSTQIAAVIYDHNDDASKGTVTFMPRWDGSGSPVPLPPVINSWEPAADTIQVWDNWMLNLRVEGIDPDGPDSLLTYQWTVDNQDWGTADSTLGNFTGEGMMDASVVVTDTSGLTATHQWKIALNGPSDVMHFTDMHPDTANPHIDTGDSLTFSMIANTPSGGPLKYFYWFNHDMVSDSATWGHTFETAGTFEVMGIVWDAGSNPSPAIDTTWTVTVTTPSAVEDEGALPTRFAVSAYPNPFNAELRLNYTLPSSAPVKVKVVDVLGRQVRLMDAGRVAAGVHTAAFDATGLASGIYFLHLDAGKWSATRKVMLVR